MNFQPLIAHNGVIHQKSNVVEKHNSSTSDPKTNQQLNIDSKTTLPKSQSSSEKQILETTESKTETLTTIEIQSTPNITNATLFKGFGESIFTLLIASPFLLFGLKKWLHR